MADQKLSALPPGGPIDPADLFYSVQGGVSVSQTAVTLRDFFLHAPSYTVAGLPPGGPLGALAVVTNGAPGQPWAGIVAGGGTARYLVWFNGANWTIVGDGGYAPGGFVPTYHIYGF